MLQVNLIFVFTILVILFRYLLFWIWDINAPDLEVMITMLSLAIGLRFGEEKGKKAKEFLEKLKEKFGKN